MRARFLRWPRRSRAGIARDVETELNFHLDMRVQELVARGLDAAEAERRAREEFGDLEFTRAYCRAVDERSERALRVADHMAEWRQDAGYALRTLRRSPGFAAVSLLTLALAIGANTAIFSAIRAVLLKPLPYDAPGSLVALYETSAGADRYPFSAPNYFDHRAQQRAFAGMAAYTANSWTWRPAAGDPEVVRVVTATPELFAVLRARPLHGRTFMADGDGRGSGVEVVVSHRFWQRALGGDAASVGVRITLNDRPYDLIGVMPQGFTVGMDEDMWLPLDLREDMAAPARSRKQHYLRVIARLDGGVTMSDARAEVQSIAARLEAQYPEANSGRGATLVPLHEAFTGDLRPPLLLLQSAAALVLLIACANLANLTLSRALGRRRELAVRAALGGGRGRLIRQLLMESVLLGLAGGAIGVTLAVLATRMLLALNPDTLPPMFAVGVDGRVLLFSVALSLATAVLFGLLPTLRAARPDLSESLRDGGRGTSGGRGGERVRRALVVAQVGLAVMLLVGAGLLVRSFGQLARVQLGYDPERVLTAQLSLGGRRYDAPQMVNRFYDGTLDGIASAPAVVAAGAAIAVPTRGRVYSTIAVEGEPVDPGSQAEVGYVLIRGDYFEALRIPLKAGRLFDATDTPDGPKTVILNEAAVRRFFPQGDAVGRRIRLGPDETGPQATIVGVVGDIRDEGLDVPASPTAFVNHRQETWYRSLALVVRTSGRPEDAAPVLRRAVRAMDPTLALRDVVTLDSVIGSSLAPRRFALGLAACFAGVALLLAAIGVYGVLSHAVAQRTREFGVRLALGATRPGIVTLVVRQGLRWSLLGLVLGIGGALAGARLLVRTLYGVSPLDVSTYASVAIGVLLVVGIACIVPAARATRVDPLACMRSE